MAVVGSCVVPHPPLIIPNVGRSEQKKIQKTVDAYKAAALEIARCAPETIVVISPHAPMYADYFHISSGKEASGSFARFGAGEVSCAVEYDEDFVSLLSRLCADEMLPAGTSGEKEKHLDHATLVPLHFINHVYTSYKLVRIGLSGLGFDVHYQLGSLIAQAAEQLGRRTYIVASGDLSHKLKEDGPYGFAEEGPVYDRKVMDVLSRADFDALVSFDESFCERAAECGHRSFVMMAGAVQTALADVTVRAGSAVCAGSGGRSVHSANISYEGPFGVGYGVCSFIFHDGMSAGDIRTGSDGSAAGDIRDLSSDTGGVCEKSAVQAEPPSDSCPYTALAKNAVESYVTDGTVISVPDGLPSEMAGRRAGVFVSLKINGELRGCIGTIAPVTRSVAHEIISNGVSAAVRDPRFPPVRRDELPHLTYSVDVLGESEPVSSMSMLDVSRYGVIVTAGFRRGLLLPDLEGVDTVEEQLDIACRKAGIRPDEDISIERFEVVRYRENRN